MTNNYIAHFETLLAFYSHRFARLSRLEWETIPGPDKWSPKQELGHLIDSCSINIQRFVRAQEMPSQSQLVYSQNHWVNACNYANRSADEILQTWHVFNRQLLEILKAMPETALQNVFMNGSETISLRFIIEYYFQHLAHHASHLSAQNGLEIRLHKPEFGWVFKEVNIWWVERHFKPEAFDYEILDHPQEAVIDQGGQVFYLFANGKPVGAVALEKIGPNTGEMSKLGVLENEHGKGYGNKLCEALIDWATAAKMNKIVLYSSTKLQAALPLYRKLGFVEVPFCSEKYGRCDVQMEMAIG